MTTSDIKRVIVRVEKEADSHRKAATSDWWGAPIAKRLVESYDRELEAWREILKQREARCR